MNEDYNKLYGKDFYENHIEGMSSSAAIVLSSIYELYKPQSVVDIGCGQGAWLKAAEDLGTKILKGFDGEWVRKEALLSKNIDFVPVNFDESMPKLNEKYDLCISLEVAEHISEENAEKFIDLLCEASDIVLFGAAIKYQGGTNHINEQWQSYWIDLFKNKGYECIDCVRGSIWNNMSVEWWYKQNTFIFIGSNNTYLKPEELRALEKPIYDIVHPTNYANKVHAYK